MSETNKKDEPILERQTAAKTRPATVRLNEIELVPELYCHRDQLTEQSVSDLFDSLIMEGLQQPIEFYTDPAGKKIVVKGHRRVTACRILAARNTPNFRQDMEIQAMEAFEATVKDLVVGSVADNVHRKTLDNIERLRATRILHEQGVDVQRGAVTLGVSRQAYERDLLVAQHTCMFDHVIQNRIPPTHAAQILKAAVDANRVDEVCQQLDSWFTDKEEEIQRRVKERKAKGLKELPEAERQVKRMVTGHLVKHWIDLIAAGQPLDDRAGWVFRAGIDPETRELVIGTFKLNVDKESAKNLAAMMSQLSLINKQLLPIVQKRKVEEEQGSGAALATSPYDLDYLREHGLGDYAEELEKEVPPWREGQSWPDDEEPQTDKEAEPPSEAQVSGSSVEDQPSEQPAATPILPPANKPSEPPSKPEASRKPPPGTAR